MQAQRIRCHFTDDIGNQKTIIGSGFFLELNESNHAFVTNKHNLDASLKMGEETTLKLKSVEIELRKITNTEETEYSREVKFCHANFQAFVHKSSDVALISCEFLKEDIDNNFCFPKLIKIKDLADQNHFEKHVNVFDTASFIGFPGTSSSQWWDTRLNMAIARTITISSMPHIPFINEAIKTSNALVVNGLSFSGSSGSLVASHSKGIKTGNGMSGGEYVEPKIIGIMSGHWWDENSTPEMFKHSGLSYITRSTSIIDILTSDFSEYLKNASS